MVVVAGCVFKKSSRGRDWLRVSLAALPGSGRETKRKGREKKEEEKEVKGKGVPITR